MIQYTLTSDSGAEPITMQQAQDQCRVDSDLDQEIISQYIIAARSIFETDTDYILTNQTWVQHRDGFPSGMICIEKKPVQSITSIEYYDEAGSLQTFASSNYNVITGARKSYIALNDGVDWPTTEDGKVDAVQITFVAGYAEPVTSCPKDIKQALLMLVGHFYDNRTAVGTMEYKSVPLGYDRLITRHRIY